MRTIKFILALLAAAPSAFAALEGSCTVNGVKGVCINTANCKMSAGQSGSANYYSGYCPNDPANVKCCIKKVNYSGRTGTCINVNSGCNGDLFSGQCPGSSNVKLCLPKVTTTPNPPSTNTCTYNGKKYNCMNPNSCTGTVISGLCSGGADNKCCVTDIADTKTKVATEVYNFFKNKGWTKNAICGLLGNMERESGLNPNINEYSGGGGYGLVQWTPGSVLKNWANARGYDYRTTNTQCLRLQYEFDLQSTNSAEKQYYKTSSCNLTFSQFSKSTKTPEELAECFMRNYERPGVLALADRKTYARKWFNYFK